MARESFLRRVFMAISCFFVFAWFILFKDLPRLFLQRRKKIENQVVVITGGAMGIGKEVSKRLAVQEKAKKEGLNTVNEINNEGGAVNIVICNAAVLRIGECLEMSEKDFKMNSDVNILGHIFTVRTFLPDMIAAQKGHIVSVGSICSYYGEHYGTAY
ncbi:hypothetical protein OSTOST_13782, partial [Ostertagia ostertagi]